MEGSARLGLGRWLSLKRRIPNISATRVYLSDLARLGAANLGSFRLARASAEYSASASLGPAGVRVLDTSRRDCVSRE